MALADAFVKLNVGGSLYSTRISTLANAPEDSILAQLAKLLAELVEEQGTSDMNLIMFHIMHNPKRRGQLNELGMDLSTVWFRDDEITTKPDAICIDGDGPSFRYVLSHLRNPRSQAEGGAEVPTNLTDCRQLMTEAQYFNLEALFIYAKLKILEREMMNTGLEMNPDGSRGPSSADAAVFRDRAKRTIDHVGMSRAGGW